MTITLFCAKDGCCFSFLASRAPQREGVSKCGDRQSKKQRMLLYVAIGFCERTGKGTLINIRHFSRMSKSIVGKSVME